VHSQGAEGDMPLCENRSRNDKHHREVVKPDIGYFREVHSKGVDAGNESTES